MATNKLTSAAAKAGTKVKLPPLPASVPRNRQREDQELKGLLDRERTARLEKEWRGLLGR